MRSDFAIFIPSNGRPDEQLTLKVLLDAGYDGDWYIVIDDLDATGQEYKDAYGEHVLIFDKKNYFYNADTYTTLEYLNTVLYARNAIEDMAKEMNLKYFWVVDDDIKGFYIRYEKDGKLASEKVTDINKMIDAFINFMESGNMTGISTGSGSSYIGGLQKFYHEPKRRSMQCIFRDTSKSIKWVSFINEDYITEVNQGIVGDIFFELREVQHSAVPLGKGRKGGNTDYYKNTSPFERSFLAVIAQPSVFCVDGKTGGIRLISKHYSYPKIISSKWKK